MKRMTAFDITIVLAACACLVLINKKRVSVSPAAAPQEFATESPTLSLPAQAKSASPSEAPAVVAADVASPALQTPRLRELDSRLADLKRELAEKQRLLETDRIKEQLNRKDLPKSTRLLFFDRIREVSKLQRQVIDLRFEQIALLQAIVEKQGHS